MRDVCAVTCTGGRPELLALCRRWVERQTVQPDLWLVVTDNGEVPDNLPPWAAHAHVEPLPAHLVTTPDSRPNYTLQQALKMVPPGHMAVVFEDDDWYGPDHVATSMFKLLEGHMVTYGEYVVEFHLPQRRWRTHQKPGASEGRVGIHPDGIATYAHHLMERPLWSGPTDGRHRCLTTVGIKGVGYGLPGRAGATPNHGSSMNWLSWPRDRGFRVFKSLLGEDADAYLELLHVPSPTA